MKISAATALFSFFFALQASVPTAALHLGSAPQISANSKAGRRLLSKARRMDEEEDDGNDAYDNYQNYQEYQQEQQQNGNDDEDDGAWIAELSLKFEGCYNTVILSEDGNDGGSPIENRGVITFQLCASGCQTCRGGVYAVALNEFVDAYTEAQLASQEYQCEMARENCNCDNDDDAVDEEECEEQCWYDLGMMFCINQNNGENGEDFEVQRYLECAEMEVNNNNNNNGDGYANGYNGYQVYNNWDGEYRVGPYCAADAKSIYLGVFYDEDCTISAGDGAYATLNYAQLPYSANSENGPLIPLDTCLPCVDEQAWDEQQQENGNDNGDDNDNNNNMQWNNMEPSEFCLQAYQDAAKCNSNSQGACLFINDFLKRLSGIDPNVHFVGAPNNNVASVFAWLFALSTLFFGAYSFYLFRKIKRGEVHLVGEEEAAKVMKEGATI